MTVAIKLKDSVFDPGGRFEGIPRNRAKLMLGGFNNGYVLHKLNPGSAANLSYNGGNKELTIGTSPLEVSDYTLELLVSADYGWGQAAFGIIQMVEQGLVEVTEDGVPITATALRTYTAP